MGARRKLAWLMLIGSSIGWPVSAFWLAKEEPQFVLGLSFLAIILTALDMIWTAEVKEDNESG